MDVGHDPVDPEDPGLEIAGQEAEVGLVPEGPQDREEKPESRILPRPDRDELLDQLGEVGQGEVADRSVWNVEEGLAKVAAADGDQVAPFLLVEKRPSHGTWARASCRSGCRTSGRPWPRPAAAPFPGEEDGDLVLVAEGRGPEDDGFGLVEGHGGLVEQGDAEGLDLLPERLRRRSELGRRPGRVPAVAAEGVMYGFAFGPVDGFGERGAEQPAPAPARGSRPAG